MPPDESLLHLLSFGRGGYGRAFAAAFGLTLAVSVASFSIGAVLGMAVALAKLSPSRLLRASAKGYTTVVRALPELLLLLVAFYAGAPALETLLRQARLAPPGFEFDPFVVAVASLGFIQGAYMTDIFRAAMIAVPAGQIEAARAFGMSRRQVFARVRLPLAARLALPGTGNIWLNATKDASFISVLGSFSDLLKTSAMAAGATRHYFFFYLVTAGLFLLLSVASMAVFAQLERRANRGMVRTV
jgi:His/Glu/Gln/Arg/opine family amino acid ABC transporter permease subunit